MENVGLVVTSAVTVSLVFYTNGSKHCKAFFDKKCQVGLGAFGRAYQPSLTKDS